MRERSDARPLWSSASLLVLGRGNKAYHHRTAPSVCDRSIAKSRTWRNLGYRGMMVYGVDGGWVLCNAPLVFG